MSNIYDMVAGGFLDQPETGEATLDMVPGDDELQLALQAVVVTEQSTRGIDMPPELAFIPVSRFLAAQE